MSWTEIQIEETAKTLRNCATRTHMSLDTVRAGILNFVADGLWRRFYAMTKVREYDRFEDFAKRWMQFPLPDLIKVFADDAEVRKVLRDAVGAKEFASIERSIRARTAAVEVEETTKAAAHGGDRKSEDQVANSHLIPTNKLSSTSRERTLRRLARDRPDLLERVKSGELSANAAAIEAGFRKKPTPLERYEAACRLCRESGVGREVLLKRLDGIYSPNE